MNMVNLAIFYYSSTGTNYQLSKWAEEAATETGANVKVRKIKELAPEEAIAQNTAWKAHYEATKDVPEATMDDLEWADGIIFSVPTRFGNVPAQVKQFMDTAGGLWAQGKTVDKVVSAMSSAQNPHGGQEATILNLYTSMFHWGAIIASPGYTNQELFAAGGNPYGVSVTVDQDGKMQEDVEKAVKHQTRRTIEITKKIAQ
ncbi:NAD(P)H:quinone oxidoreductase [Aquibacillus rhizosphaerae]|uniref:NAD(P)H:quinone oxidoreductase n=1 Tax=Aquibacillus rhizosphaerae TaxID=3051431 RepID=A0ABT7LDQ4_9BACI|nr:NAD(P)H:quinone oxidoreductase [Aquibacillus sp. LR5S19]MDL4842725.1 NAD(P)H:quinone oxidoreductase [Aquibacillus sp. LR5S19]